MQNAAQFTDTSRYAIIASGEHVWTLARDIKDGNFQAPFILDLPPGRKRRSHLAIEGPLRLRRARLERSADPGGRKNLHPGHRTRRSPAGPRRHAAARAGDPAARRQGDLEVRSRPAAARQPLHVVGLQRPADRRPAAAGLSRRGDLRRNPPGRLRAARRRFGAPDWGFAYQTDAVQGQSRFFWGWMRKHAGHGPDTHGRACRFRAARRFCSKGCNRLV